MEEKIIHYCWFGNKPLNKLAKKCIKSWKKFFPQYKIIEWNERNFDIHINKFCEEAYTQKKWAFVADVARCYALKEFGGLYFDTDMCVTKNIDDILSYSFEAGWESEYNVAACIIWAKEAHNEIIESLWEYYENTTFDLQNVYSFSIPVLLTNILQKSFGLKYYNGDIQILRDKVCIYPRDYFYPIPSGGDLYQTLFTDNTCMIHYYIGSWLPRDLKLRAIFRLKFGDKWGNRLLDILVAGKRICRSILKILGYPYIRYKRKKNEELIIKGYIKSFDDQVAKISIYNYIAFYNRNWLGTGIATKDMFMNAVGIEEVYHDEVAEHIVQYILDHDIKLVIFSAFSIGWKTIIQKLKKRRPNIVIKTIWHGSLALNVEYYDWERFKEIMSLYSAGEVDSLGFVKKSLYEFFACKGFKAEFISNMVKIDTTSCEEIKIANNSDGDLKIGLYASGDRWVKNFYNQLAAASLFKGAVVNCIPLSEKTVVLAKYFGINITGSYKNVSREKMLGLLASNDINFYVTFSECAPLLPLESMEMGVPCITGDNHHYWQGTPLEKYLVVSRNDDCIAIYEKAKVCLEHKNEIMELYNEWKKDFNKQSKESIGKFLEI